MTYRVIKRLLTRAESLLVPPFAKLYRPLLRGTRFIGVTGSCGKTTTKELIADTLSQFEPTHRSFDSNNIFLAVARTILEVRRGQRNCVIEVSASGPGSIGRSVTLVKPEMAVVTSIGEDHYKAFRGAQAAATEKKQLVAALSADGIAVLNSDDANVIAMADDCAGTVLSYGLNENADVRGEIVKWHWPSRLGLKVIHQGNSVLVETQLLGSHLASSILAALATVIACGISLDKAAAAIATAKPVFGRMSSKPSRGGVTFIYDNFKAPLWTIEPVITYLRSARAKRRIIVIGTISDYGGSSSSKYRAVARNALDGIDLVIFASRFAPSHLRKIKADYPERLQLFSNTSEAANYVASVVTSGDLVLLKGSLRSDHLERIPMHYESSIECWRTNCGREIFCGQCDLKNAPVTVEADS